MKYKKILCCICMLFLLPLSSITIQAYGRSEVPVMLEEETDDDGNDFIAEALQSLDEQTAQEEAGENYLTNFFNSAQTASSESFNLFKPDTWIMTIINLFTMILEMFGAVVTFFTMVLYNFVSSSFLSSIVSDVISGIERIMFDWNDMNSWVIKVLVLSTLIGLIYSYIKDFTHIRGYKQMLMIALSAVMSMTFVIFIGRNGRNIISSIEDAIQTTVVETFVFDGQASNMEIANKENIFDTMQLQPFMLRHFGTTSYENIAAKSGQSVDEAKERVQQLLDDPSTDNAEKEYDNYENHAISHDSVSSGVVFFLSLITLVHKALIGIIIAIICIAVGAVKLLKELLLWLSVYQLIWWLIKRDHKAQQWFTDRMMWSFLAIGADLLFSTALYFIMQMCTRVSAIHPLFLIGFDVLLLVIILFAKKNFSKIMAWLKDNGSEALKTMLTGSTTPLQFFNQNKNWNKNDTSDFSGDGSAGDDDHAATDDDLSDAAGTNDDNVSDEDLSDRSEDNDNQTDDTSAADSDQSDPDISDDHESDHADPDEEEMIENDLDTRETDDMNLSDDDENNSDQYESNDPDLSEDQENDDTNSDDLSEEAVGTNDDNVSDEDLSDRSEDNDDQTDDTSAADSDQSDPDLSEDQENDDTNSDDLSNVDEGNSDQPSESGHSDYEDDQPKEEHDTDAPVDTDTPNEADDEKDHHQPEAPSVSDNHENDQKTNDSKEDQDETVLETSDLR